MKKKSISFAGARAAAAFAVSLSTAAPAAAADWTTSILTPPSSFVFAPPATYVADFGTRFWFGRARTSKDLFDDTGALLLSRLDYHEMSIFTAEAFARFDFNNGWFLKAYTGGGGLFNGRLRDEDFPPVTVPYSATLSDQRGSLFYGSIDAGVTLFRGPDFRVGTFVGYHFMRDTVEAFGCAQVAANPDICGDGGIPTSIRGISQNNNWHSLRLGLEAQVDLGSRWRVGVDAAWLPVVQLYGSDAHWLRIGTDPGSFTGPVPEDGRGWGYQIDAFLNYRVNDWLTLGGGGRYWRVQANGYTHFEGHVVGFDAVPQVVRWRADHFGGFLQANVRFGPYDVITRN